MIHPTSKQWPFQADGVTSKAGQHRNIIKAERWCWKTKAKDSNRMCQTSTPHIKLDTCCSLLASKSPSNQEVSYHVVNVPLSFTNELTSTLSNPLPPLSIILPRFCSSNYFCIIYPHFSSSPNITLSFCSFRHEWLFHKRRNNNFNSFRPSGNYISLSTRHKSELHAVTLTDRPGLISKIKTITWGEIKIS